MSAANGALAPAEVRILDGLVEAWPGYKHGSPGKHILFRCPVCDGGEVTYYPHDGHMICLSASGCRPADIIARLRGGQVPVNDPKEMERRDETDATPTTAEVTKERRRLRARRLAIEAEAEAADDPDAWAPESLTRADPVPEPSILEVGKGSGQHLVRLGDIVGVHGAYGSGKTPVCYLAAAEQVQRGGMALVVDYEMGQSGALAMLRELGLSDEQIEAGIYYVYSPPTLTDAARCRLVEGVNEREDATGRRLNVIVVDSLTQSMAMVPGASDNDAQDVTAWADSLPKWLRDQFKAAVFVIDHSGRSDGPHPSGSHKKLEVSQYHLWCKKGATFSREKPDEGYSTLVVVKDRSGRSVLNEAVAVLRTVRSGSFALHVPGTVPEGAEHQVEIPLDQMSDALVAEDEVLERLRAAGDGGLLTVEITGSGASAKRLRKAIDRVVERNLVRGVATRGPGKRYWLVT